MLIDTHAHINFPDFESDLDQVINNSIKNGVEKIICVSANLSHSIKAIEIAKKYPGIVYAAIGIHPQQTDPENKDSLPKQIEKLKELVANNQIIAIGECGLDFSEAPKPEKNRSPENQVFLFKKQIEIAQEFHLPLIVHSRKSLAQTLEILNPLKNKITGVIHCYSGGKSDIHKIEEIGFYFGLDGNLTYDIGLQNVAKLIPLEKIVLETDCPFLTPQPYRGLRNKPKNVKIIAEFLAEIKGISLQEQEISQKTTKNAQDLFKIKK
ncbi:MAG: TatD family hydrolase [Candidatus Shapirobacteria bacterium]|nr:TatD family hydrolase [Candidatus Shapirobacteria bacterium]